MKISSLVPYFGGKRNMASIICQELGEHCSYWEPFCGSMAVLLKKERCSMETVNDLYDDITNLIKVLQDATEGPKFYRKIRRTLISQSIFEECRNRYLSVKDSVILKNKIEPQRAYDFFICSWQGINGLCGTKSYKAGFARRFTKSGGHAARRFASAVDSIPAWRKRIRNVTVLKSCGIEICEKIEDAKGVVIYADPPYITKGAEYVFDFTKGHHERLALALSKYKKTRVIVSYYDCPEVRELYKGWTFVNCHRSKSLASQSKKGGNNDITAPEVLIINGDSYTNNTGLFC